jgi:glucokinase
VILAADIGGTNTRLALCEAEDGRPRVIASETFASANHASLEDIIELFLSSHVAGGVASACIGVAGPVKEERVVLTNLPWAVDAQLLSRRVSIPRVELINDVEANAWGIGALSPPDFLTLNGGAAIPGATAVLVAVGTGLGQAGLVWNGRDYRPSPSEGGHADFAPRNALEIELLQYLQHKLNRRVSYERVLSGPGLVNLFRFLRDTERGEEPEHFAPVLASRDAPAVISAEADRCALADAALQLFVAIYGALVGNVALQFMAMGGVYLGGGITPKIVSRLKSGIFMDAYLDKGRLSPILAKIPVQAIMNDKTALLGAARRALQA